MRSKRGYNWIFTGTALLVLLALPLFSMADDNTSLFEQGNAAYAKGQYTQAAQDYQKIVDAGYQSVAVYFNLGNAYYRTGDIASSILYYEKAHKLAPSDEDINANIRFANARTSDKVEPLPEFFVTKWWNSVILFFSVNTLATLSVLFMLGGCGLLIFYLFTNSGWAKRSAFYTSMVVIVAAIVFVFMANRQESYFGGHQQAIIFSNSVTAKNEPDANGKPLFIVHEGTKVNVLQQTDTWMEVELPNGNAGWISVNDAKDI
jgi:tetratricopeptide (TPR) repeat protein